MSGRRGDGSTTPDEHADNSSPAPDERIGNDVPAPEERIGNDVPAPEERIGVPAEAAPATPAGLVGHPPRTLGEALTAATAGLPAPLVAVDLDALEDNFDDLLHRASGRPLRVASKSVRVRAVLDLVLARPGVVGVMAYSPWEAAWLAGAGVADVLVGYPTADEGALDAIASDEAAAASVTLMVDDLAQAVRASRAAAAHGRTLRVCLDVDASLRLLGGRIHLGVRRSPVHAPDEVASLAASVARLPGLAVRGLMFYEAQVAGLPDSSPAVRAVKRASLADLARRRSAVLAAVRAAVGEVELVNGGGTGSVEATAADPAVTEVTAGSGLFAPTLFDGYRAFRPRPAAFVGLDVVRVPGPGYVTVFGGGYVASGPAAPSRLPRPVWPRGLRLTGREGAGEVQTPLRLARGRTLAVGDRAWFRHAKAGEVMERFAEVHLVRGDRLERTVPTYRGEGRSFG